MSNIVSSRDYFIVSLARKKYPAEFVVYCFLNTFDLPLGDFIRNKTVNTQVLCLGPDCVTSAVSKQLENMIALAILEQLKKSCRDDQFDVSHIHQEIQKHFCN